MVYAYYSIGNHEQRAVPKMGLGNSAIIFQDWEKRSYQLGWLIGPLCVNCRGFPPPADVNRTLCGGGVPGGRTHTAL